MVSSIRRRQCLSGSRLRTPDCRLSHEPPASGAKDEDAYRAELTRALIDHHVSRTEIRQLERAALAAGLSADDVEAINEEFTRQLVIEAWADGVITDEEHRTLIDIATALEVDVARIRSLLDEPQAPTSPTQFTLSPGDRVAFTGSLDIPYEIWAQRAAAAGLDVGDVTRKCVLLVAANPDTMSGKAQKARAHGVPIVGEAAFAKFLSTLERDGAAAPADDSGVAAQFPWLSADQVRTAGASRSRVAAAWIARHPTQPLHMLADDLRPNHTPEATGAGIDRYLALWSLHHPQMLSANADDLLALPGVGEKRRHKLVELVVDLAADGVGEVAEPAAVAEPVREPVAVEPPAGTDPVEPWPSFDDVPAQDPTPEELIAKARSTSYNPYAIPATATPLEPAPLPAERTNRAARVFKWSAIIAVASFFLFGMRLETFDPEAESFIAGHFAVVFLFGGLTAAVAGIRALVNRLGR